MEAHCSAWAWLVVASYGCLIIGELSASGRMLLASCRLGSPMTNT
jgi:hypothetical protein